MKKIVFILFGFTFLNVNQIFAQNQVDPIQVEKGFITMFSQNGRNLNLRQMMDITRSNPEAYAEMKIAKTNYDVSCVFGFTGGFCVGWPIGTAIGGGEANWTLAGIGAGLIGVSIVFNSSAVKSSKKAVGIYNKGLKATSYRPVEFKVGPTANGIGLTMKF